MAKKGYVDIDRERCKGCYLCVRACPLKVLEPDTAPNAAGTYPVRAARGEKCIACASCFEVCPDVCITLYEDGGSAAAERSAA
ncbi:MAG: ferredoxin family protein [Treponema sp.]|jgi:2-oxoglutarate ferredoxin oxidoreductase subunit delta|nr:ferredoxin family protein [Treponema sp.]